jgi:hypothetical protein
LCGKWKTHLDKVRSTIEEKKEEHDAKAAACMDAVYARANAAALNS